MPSRRRVLAALGAGAVSALAGCGCEAFPGRDLTLSIEEIDGSQDRWELDVRAAASFLNPDEDASIDGIDIAAYSRDRRLLDHDTIGDLAWADVPEDRRTDGECADSGGIASTASLTTDEVPYYVGPRFLDGETARAFDGTSGGFERILALRYGTETTPRRRPVTAAGSRNETTTQRSTPNDSDRRSPATDGSDGRAAETPSPATRTPAQWPPTNPAADDYRTVDVEALPWPRPVEQALTETPTFSSVEFRAESACLPGQRDPRVSQFGSDETVRVQWNRSIPAESCLRPFLTGVAYDAGVLTLTIGLQEVSAVLCRECERLPYIFRATYRDDETTALSEVVVEHRSPAGDLVERRVVTPE